MTTVLIYQQAGSWSKTIMISMRLLLFTLLLVLNFDNKAANFCVETSAEFQSALTTAGNNGQDDVIKLKSGSYYTSGAPFFFNSAEDFDLNISGGWYDFNQFGCVAQETSPLNTYLNGNDSDSILLLSTQIIGATSQFTISHLTFEWGYIHDNFDNGILTFNGAGFDFLGEILIDRVLFRRNLSLAAIVKIYEGNQVSIRNSVFSKNYIADRNGVVDIHFPDDNYGLYFINNTITGNTLFSSVTAGNDYTIGLKLSINQTINGTPKAFIANNIFWNDINYSDNGIPVDVFEIELSDTGGIHYVYNNDFQTMNSPAEFQSDNLSVNPMLTLPDLTDFTPLPGSPVINAGLSAPESGSNFEDMWDYGNSDFDGFSRVIDNRVDIGAVEALPEVPIFENGFE